MQDAIIALYQAKPEDYSQADRDLFLAFIQALNSGRIRACEPTAQGWKVNQWIKMGILTGFRLGCADALALERPQGLLRQGHAAGKGFLA